MFQKYKLIQANNFPTNGSNTLDLFFTNDMALFIDIEVNKTGKSYHNIMAASTIYCMELEERIVIYHVMMPANKII